MQIEEFGLPRPHIIIKNFLTEEQQKIVLDQIKSLPYEKGLVHINGEGLKHDPSRKNVLNYFPTDREIYQFLKIFDEKIYVELQDLYKNARYPIFETILHTNNNVVQIGKYEKNHHYDWHMDSEGFVTFNYMISDTNVKGGDFIIKYNEEEKVIPFESNTMLLFPSRSKHKVTPIESGVRYTVQYWNW